MEPRRNSLLADMARDAAIERSDFLVRAGEQLDRFVSANASRIREIGGLTLIDDEPDYLAIAPDGSFRSRARVFDDASGEWVSETEVIDTAAELVELYNPADVLQAFADAEEDDAGLDDGAAEVEDGDEQNGSNPYAGAAEAWAAGQPAVREADDETSAAAALYDLALDFQERSQRAEAGLLEQFENASAGLLGKLPTVVVVDDDDEHLALGVGGFRGRVIPEGETAWQDLGGPDEIVRFYDPTDVFGDLAEAIAEAYPNAAAGDDMATSNGADGANGSAGSPDSDELIDAD
jgi:hypothetical protein